MKLAPKKREEISAALAPTLWVITGFSLIFALAASASDPAWWNSRNAVIPEQVITNSGVVTTNYVPNPYAVVTQGQLKQFTARAVDELNANFSTFGGAGPALTNMVYGWQQDYATNNYNSGPTAPYKPSDFTAMTVGQLKYVGNLIWGRLAAGGYTNAVPSWLAQNTSTDNFAATLGQLKEIFDFDLTLDSDGNGLPDWWELEYFGHTGNNAASSPDGNGETLVQDYQQGNNPTNYYSQNGSIITPILAVTGGNNQSAPQATFCNQPFTVHVTRSGGNVLTGAPVTFSATAGHFSTTLGGPAASTLTVASDSSGTATVYYAGPDVAGTTNSIQVSSGGVSASMTESTQMSDGTIAGVSNVQEYPGPANGQITVTWQNHATNATVIYIQQSIDDVNWVTVATLSDPTATSYTQTETNLQQNYYFGVIAGTP